MSDDTPFPGSGADSGADSGTDATGEPEADRGTDPGTDPGAQRGFDSGADSGPDLPEPGPPGVRAPQQERSRRTLARIAAAALDLIAEQGVEATTVQQIVKRARSSVGSFYARFDGKEDLLLYLEARVWDEARERWDAAVAARSWQGLGLEEAAEGAVRLLLRVTRTDAAQRRALGAHHLARGPSAAAVAFREHIRHGLGALLLEHRGAMGHPDPERAVDVAFRVLVGGIEELERARAAGGEGVAGAPAVLGDEAVVAELTRLLLAYLGSDAAPGDDGAGVEFFEIWED